MCDSLYESVNRITSWWMIALLVVANIACIAGFSWRERSFDIQKSPDAYQRGYTSKQVHDFLQNIGSNGRSLYVKTQLTLDVVYPVVYGLLFAMLLVVFFCWETTRCVVLLPVATVVFDLLENFSTVFLAKTFTEEHVSDFAKVASIFTQAKWGGVYLCGLLIGVGAVLKFVSVIRAAFAS